MNLGRLRIAAPVAAAALMLLAACSDTGETVEEHRAIDLDGATRADVRLEFDAGRLTVKPDASGLADARFRYNVDDWQPDVSYTVSDALGQLRIEQGNGNVSLLDIDDVTNRWTIALNPAIPMALDIEVGAGDTDIDLRGMTLTGIDITQGAGDATVNLAGAWNDDLDGHIEAGAGRLTLRLPRDIGVRVEVDRGISDVDVSGLTRDGNLYTNGAWGTTDAALTLTIEQGVGEINLEVVE